MSRLYRILGWGVVLLGSVHMLGTWAYFSDLTDAALWFFSGGMMLVLVGALNLLNSAYGSVAPALRIVCIGANATAAAFGAVAGLVSGASVAQFALVLGLLGAATLLSFSRLVVAERAST